MDRLTGRPDMTSAVYKGRKAPTQTTTYKQLSFFKVIKSSRDSCRRNLVLTDLLAFAIDFWMLPRYIPEHLGIFSEV